MQEFIDRMVGIRSGSAIKLNNNNIPKARVSLVSSSALGQTAETLLINPQGSSRRIEMGTIPVSHFTDTTYCVRS